MRCPSLKHLGLASALFAKCSSHITDEDTVTRLLRMLKKLTNHGLRLQVIQIVEPQNLSRRAAELLKEVACAGKFDVCGRWFRCVDKSCKKSHREAQAIEDSEPFL